MEEERLAEKRTPLPKPPPIKTDGEKEALRNKMKEKVTYYSVFIYILKLGFKHILCHTDHFRPQTYPSSYKDVNVPGKLIAKNIITINNKSFQCF